MPRKLDRRHRARLLNPLFDCDLTATTFQSLIETAGSPIICLDRQFRITVFNPAAERAFGLARQEASGRRYADLLPQIVRSKVRADLRRVLDGATIEQFENVIRRPDGGYTVLLWNITKLRAGDGAPAGIVLVGQDITTLQRIHERLIRQTHHLVGLSRIDRAIIALQPPRAIAEAAVRHLEGVTGCDAAAVVAHDAVARHAVRLASAGADPLSIPDARPLDAADFAESGWPDSPGAPLTVPLIANNVRLGSLLMRWTDGVDVLTLGAIETIGQVADRLAIALDNARLFEAERQARRQFQAASARVVRVQETERRRIAQELHDDIGQELTGLKLELETHRRQRGSDDPDLERPLAMVQGLIARVRNLSLDLRPSLLDDLGLVPALISLIERYSSQTGIRVALDHHGSTGRFPADVETAAFRIVQEALTNIAKHAAVDEASVRLDADSVALRIVVQDRGRGFDPGVPPAEPTTGVSSMRERAAMLDGRLTVDAAPGRGTAVRAVLPTAGPRRPKPAAARRRRTPAS